MKTRKDTDKISLPSMDDVPDAYWSKLAEKKVFFGHQSVGYNIMDGIMDVMRERDSIQLNILETCDPEEFDEAIFAHSKVGTNTNPGSKIEAFSDIVEAGVGHKVDIAFFKFCYVDIMRSSDPQEIFDRYKAALDNLENRYPETTFLHVTVPVLSVPKDTKNHFKQSMKLFLGKPGLLDDNAARQRYNTLLKNACASQKRSVFDLALIETVNPDGLRYYVSKGGQQVCVMVPEYTDDGGHLNHQGRKRVAEQLLIFLAEVANKLG
jgi:hypothetical protein